VAQDPRHFCCRTRVCERIVSAATDSGDLVSTLQDLGATLDQKAVIFPCTDASVLVLSRHREALHTWYHIVLPEHEVVETLLDKRAFYLYAEREGLPIPRTILLSSSEDAERAAGALRFPCVLKPPLKTARWEEKTGVKGYKVDEPRELVALYNQTAPLTDLLVAQEWIEGGYENLFTCNCYFGKNSEPLVTFVTRKIRQWPPETGTGSLGEECRNDVVLAETIQLFKRVRFRGLGYLEMKRDDRTGMHVITEPNIGRPTGRSATAEASGVELLYTQYCDALGLPVPDNLEQPYIGTKWMYFGRDLRAALYEWRRGQLGLRAWWRSLRGVKVDAVFSWKDPMPFLFDLWRGGKGLATTRA
jgi:D-aspartate ligase